MTWALPADQRRLLDIFAGQLDPLRDVFELPPSGSIRHFDSNLLLLWRDDPRRGHRSPLQDAEGGLPDSIILWSGSMREFLAWATTVIGGFRPFTAFFKVASRHHLERAVRLQEPTLGRLENALVGVIIGEALAHSASNHRALADLPLLASESTCAFVSARAWALGYRADRHGDSVVDLWTLARKLTRQPARRLGTDSIETALAVVAALDPRFGDFDRMRLSPFIQNACLELHQRGEVRTSWSLLDGELNALGSDMKGTREQRVRAFERVFRRGSSHSFDLVTAAFLMGLLVDQIGPGTFEHFELLAPYLQDLPMAAVWYGLCAGLHPDSEVQQVGNCLGRRIARDLLAPDSLMSPPKHDISVHELEVCLDREIPVEFRTASQSHMAVELLPGVPTFLKWPIRDSPQQSDSLATETPATPLNGQRDLFVGKSNADLVAKGAAAIVEIEGAATRARAVFDALTKRGLVEGEGRSGARKRRGNRR